MVADSCIHSASVGHLPMKLAVKDMECHCEHARVAHTNDLECPSGHPRQGHSVALVKMLVLTHSLAASFPLHHHASAVSVWTTPLSSPVSSSDLDPEAFHPDPLALFLEPPFEATYTSVLHPQLI